MFDETEHRQGGYSRGSRDARLDAHDAILKRLEQAQVISGIIAFLGIGWLSLSTQRLGDGARASAATAIALAQALKEEKDTARDTLATENNTSQNKWSKSNTLIAAVGVLIPLIVGLIAYLATKTG